MNLEVLDLRWPELATVWYVRGHVDVAAAVAAVRAHLEDEVEQEERDHVPALGGGAHIYARWAMGRDEHEQLTRQLFDRVERGPGAFAVTEIVDLDERAAREAAREAERQHAAALEAWVRARWPEATWVRSHGYPPRGGTVRFGLPEIEGDVYHDARRPGVVTIRQGDRAVWERLYSSRPSPIPHPNDPEAP